VPENTLEALCDGVHSHTEGVWETPAEPLPQNGHAPVPEVHPPPPVPEKALLELPRSLSEVKKAVQKAPPAPEPAPVADKGAPAEVVGGAPMAPPAPREADGHSRTIGITLDLSLLTPEEKERALEGLRKALARLPKPGGILQQKGTPIVGVYPPQAPPELAEYFRAKACALAAEACGVVEKGGFEEWRLEEARCVWGLAAQNLASLIALTPTREVLAAVFLAHANAFALWAAEDPRLRDSACLIAKAAGAVFFGKAHPDVLLRVLLETPPPTEYDIDLATHYRFAAGYLVAAHWVLTGGDLKRLTGWIWPARWKRDDAEAMLLFSLGSEKKALASAHLYLGDLPF